MTDDLPAVLVDTDVYSRAVLLTGKSRHNATARWTEALRGSRVVISFQTRAEILAGAQLRGWEPDRMARTRGQLDSTPMISVDAGVIEAYIHLTVACRRIGHGLHAKDHTGDRWIAACAIAKVLPLLSGDGVFTDAPGLTLLTLPGGVDGY